MPGVLGCFASAVAIRSATNNNIYHGDSRQELFHNHGYELAAARQILGLLITWGLSISGGLLCGVILKSKVFVQNKNFFKDSEEFIVPEGELDEIMRGTIRGKPMLESINRSEQSD